MKINNRSPKLTFTSRRNKALVVLFTTLAMSTDSLAEIIQIEFTQFDTYSIEVAHIGVGDTVEWLPKNKGHNVEFLAGPDMADLPPKSNMNEFHSVRFDKQGVYLYGCTPHLNMGMLGLVLVGNDLHNIAEIGNIDLPNVAKSVLMSLIRDAQSSAKSN
jgi:pseudoazurin